MQQIKGNKQGKTLRIGKNLCYFTGKKKTGKIINRRTLKDGFVDLIEINDEGITEPNYYLYLFTKETKIHICGKKFFLLKELLLLG